ncbi:MAG: RNA-binding protein [Clostridia bacterium]|nr:RNA-binding protein [Clostridia bacterium]
MKIGGHEQTEQLAANLLRLCEKRYEPCYSQFLSESEAAQAARYLESAGCRNYKMYGGYEGAQRVMLCVYPEYCEPNGGDFPFDTVNLKYRKSAELTHRDFLGSLMGLGITRESVGDILISEGYATFFVRSELAPFVLSQLGKVGREGVSFCTKGVDIEKLEQKFEERRATVASMRADAVVGEITGMSRQKSQQAIKSGVVAVNALTIDKTDHKIQDGDKISVRGFGKFMIKTDGSLSRKGKTVIAVLKYI